MKTLLDAVEQRATHDGDRAAYRFFATGEPDSPIQARTWQQVWAHGTAVAAHLQQLGLAKERALLLMGDDIHFIDAFFGCLLAGVVAVPVTPPDPRRLDRTLPRLRGIAQDCGATVILTTSLIQSMAGALRGLAPDLHAMRWIVVDAIEPAEAEQWRRPEPLGPESLAVLQYTSGSTGSPAGVRVSHENLVAYCDVARRLYRMDRDTRVFTWLPLFHDMGLMGGIVVPTRVGNRYDWMSPTAFLRRPMRWPEILSAEQITFTAGPDFAYALCARKADPDRVAQLDLSPLRVAVNSAEPVRMRSMEAFVRALAPAGLRPDALLPAYGLAEATLGATGFPEPTPPRELKLDPQALSRNVVRESTGPEHRSLVSCGAVAPELELRIVDPERAEVQPERTIGEIWLRGPTMTTGYWRERVEARPLSGTLDDAGPWLRTGDLGLMDGGELFVVGRVKDVIIVRGRNHHPHDIEATVTGCHPRVRPGCVIACSGELFDEEQLFIAAEVDERGLDPDERSEVLDQMVARIRERVGEEHGITPGRIALLAARTIDKTSSGKLARSHCRARFGDGSLDALHQWQRVRSRDESHKSVSGAMQDWLRGQIAELAGLDDAGSVDLDMSFDRLGLDSASLVSLSADLGEQVGSTVNVAALYDHPTPRALLEHLSALPRASQPSVTATSGPIAIVGMACRAPGGVCDPDDLWALLDGGVDAITSECPPRPGAETTGHGGFLDDIDHFDAGLFGIPEREADWLDPQQRLLLECSWEAIEGAGIDPNTQRGRDLGVFMGISNHDYAQLALRDPQRLEAWAAVGSSHAASVGRLSHVFDGRGPNLAIDTACSSGLVAIHQACQSLRAGECSLALAGGVNVILTAGGTLALRAMGALSPTGRCRSFGAEADGYVRAEGCGVVLLKPLADARRDGDVVHAVIEGSAVNQDGGSNGLTAPRGSAQREVIRTALQRAGIEPRAVGYVEAHGTGTPLGDPIEAMALSSVYGEGRERPLLVGSIKSNIGHAESAAGVLGLIKAVLVLAHGRAPASLHALPPNPRLAALDQLMVCAEPQALHSPSVGVSSFGFSGTNAHVVLTRDRNEPTRSENSSPRAGRPSPRSLQRRRHWLPHPASSASSPRAYYDALDAAIEEPRETRLTFGPLAAAPEGFSWLRTFLEPGRVPAHVRLATRAQHDLRRALWRGAPTPHRVLDVGCGYGTDLVDLALAHPGLVGHGLTLSEAQRTRAHRSIVQEGLESRVFVERGDSTQATLNGSFDVILALEVIHHIHDKRALLANVQPHLAAGGRWLIADFVAQGAGTIEHARTSSWFIDAATWASLLAQHELRLDAVVDITPQAACFLRDDDFDAVLAEHPQRAEEPELRASFESYRGLGTLLDRGGARYVLLQASHHPGEESSALEAHNREALDNPTAWSTQEPGGWLHTVTWRAVDPPEGEPLALGESPTGLRDLGDTWSPPAPLVLAKHSTSTPMRRGAQAVAATMWHEQGYGALTIVEVDARGRATAPSLTPWCPPDAAEFEPNSEEAVLITGGLGGIGRRLVDWLARERGVRHVVLVSRGAGDAETDPDVLRWRAAGLMVELVSADIADASRVHALLRALYERGVRLGQVFHAAAQRVDAPWSDVDDDALQAAMSARVDGSRVLLDGLGEHPVRAIWLFTSIAGLLGSVGQGAYAAAAGWAMGLAEDERRRGRPITAIAWGPWSEVGMAAEHGSTGWMAAAGLPAMDPADALDALSRVMDAGELPPAVVAIAAFDPAVLRTQPQLPPSLRALPGVGSHSGGPMAREVDVERTVRREVAELLERAPEAIAMDATWSDLGLDSLLSIELQQRLSRALGVTLGTSAITRSLGPASLVASLRIARSETAPNFAGSTPVASPSPRTIEPGPAPDSDPTVGVDEPNELLVTGGTGFVGAFIIDELLRRTSARIRVLVRAPDVSRARERLLANLARHGIVGPGDQRWSRIEVVLGDLAMPQLGLSDARWAELGDSLDGIIHSGAQLSYVLGVDQLSPTNVGGTKTLLSLAAGATHPCPFHFVSTLAVFESAPAGQRMTEQSPLHLGRPFILGYSNSKAIAEALVWEAAEAGQAVTVHRPGLVGGSLQQGSWNSDDFTCRLLSTVARLGLLPDIDMELDLVPVDVLAQDIVALALHGAAQGRAWHHRAAQPMSLRMVQQWLARRGHATQWVSPRRWAQAIQERAGDQSSALRALLPFFVDRDHGDGLTGFERYGDALCVSGEQTRAMLTELGAPVPPAVDSMLAERCGDGLQWILPPAR